MSTDNPPTSDPSATPPAGLTARQAKSVELSIIGLCVFAVFLIFQPWSLTLYGVGAGLVVLGGLLFNLVPLCQPGVQARSLIKAAVIVFGILFVVIALAMGAVQLYGLYLKG